MGKTCVICGKPSGMYPLCRLHLQMKADGEVIKCEECGTWHLVNEPCACKQDYNYFSFPIEGYDSCVSCGAVTKGKPFCKKCWKEYTPTELYRMLNFKKEQPQLQNDFAESSTTVETPPVENNVVVIDNSSKSKCITCGKKTDGLLFCAQCFGKYKNKELLVKITNCTSVELLDDSYEGRYTCKDGHVVKSKSERDIDNYLFEHGISHAYEKELPYGGEKNEVLHPDFFLPNYLGKDKHVYIEHWGYNENNLQYTKTKKFKMPIYRQSGITLICTYEKADSGKIDSVLERKLNIKFIKENEINYEE